MPSDKDIVETDRLLRAADKQASVIHDLVYAKPFDVKAISDAVWVLHGILRAKQRTNPPWCSVCAAPHNFGEGDICAAILKSQAENDQLKQHVADLNHDLECVIKECNERHG